MQRADVGDFQQTLALRIIQLAVEGDGAGNFSMNHRPPFFPEDIQLDLDARQRDFLALSVHGQGDRRARSQGRQQ
ncbi:hypothetical protein D3C76_751910 [compost metagenome]